MHLITGLVLGELLLGKRLLQRGAGPLPFEMVHALPGRLRVRVAVARDNPAACQALQDLLHELPAVTRASADPRSGSVLVQYRDSEQARRAVIGALERATAPGEQAPAPQAGPDQPPLLRSRISELSGRANRGLLRQTGGLTDLGTLAAVAAGAWGVKTVLRPGAISRWQGLTLIYWSYNMLRH
jgi:hypothetical protein